MMTRQFITFLFVGGLTVLIDFTTYNVLYYIDMNFDIAKTIGFLTGTIFAYFANKQWTFQARGGVNVFFVFIVLYFCTLGLNVGTNHMVLKILGENPLNVNLAFIFATGLSATTNFLGMKFLVFKGNER